MESRIQQHSSNSFTRRTSPNRTLWGSKGQNSTFSEHGHVAFHIKWNHECSNMVAILLPADPPPPPNPTLWGSKGQNSTFSEHGHVAYQIKGYHDYSNMVANILPATPTHPPPPTLWWLGQNVKIKLLQSLVTLHIQLKGITNAATCKHIFCPFTHHDLWVGVKRQKNFILKVVMLHIKLREWSMGHHTPDKPSSHGVGSYAKTFFFCKQSSCISE